MNPRHAKFLEKVMLKFRLLSSEQAHGLLRNTLGRAATYRVLQSLIRDGKIARALNPNDGKRMYVVKKLAYAVIPEQYAVPTRYLQATEIQHRIACNDVFLALASRSAICGMVLEHELDNYEPIVPYLKRRPDGIAIIGRGENRFLKIAIEVETTHRNNRRVEELFKRYVRCFTEQAHLLSGVLVVSDSPTIMQVYRSVIESSTNPFPRRFLLSSHLDLSDVQESIWGRAFSHPTDNPKKPVETVFTTSTSLPSYFDLSKFAANEGTHSGFRTQIH